MTTREQLLRAPAVEPLGWTLAHFLWQGAAVAALLAGTLQLLRRHTPQARYLAGCVSLLVMAACPAITMGLLTSRPALQAGMPAANFRTGIITMASSGSSVKDLAGKNLSGANLSGANLPGTNLADVDLSRVNLSGARRAAISPSVGGLSTVS